MAQGSKSTGGLFVGGLLVLFVGGGLAATPFYLNKLLPPERAADQAVMPEVEEVRRVALELDQHLSLMQDIYKSGIPGTVPEQDELDHQTRTEEGGGVPRNRTPMAAAEISSLEQTSRLLRETMTRDKERGLPIAEVGKKLQSGVPDANRANTELRKTYFAQQDKILREADSAMQKLRSAQGAGRGGVGSLWAARVAAMLELARGELHRQRMEFESREMALAYQSAAQRAEGLREVRRLQDVLAAQKPEESLAAVDRQIEAVEAETGSVSERLARLETEIKSKRGRVATLERSAADARKRMQQIAQASGSGAPYPSEYSALSEGARKAELEAAELVNGTLTGAKPTSDFSAGREAPAYEGGTVQAGLREMEYRRDTLKSQIDLLAADRVRLAKEKESLNQWQQQLDERKAGLEKTADELARGVKADIETAEKFAMASSEAYEAAVKSLSAAATQAKQAVTGAKNRTAEARQAGSGPKPDERLQRVAADGDPEASMHCLAADVAYRLALCHAARIDATANQLSGQTRLAALTGSEPPKSKAEEIERLRTDAQNLLADALKSYEQAANLISKTNVKFADASVSGKNYAWAVNVGQAAVHLVQAQLQSAEAAEDGFAQKSLAYNLLKEAAKGREQSALLSPAIDTALYLQQSARKTEPKPAITEKEPEGEEPEDSDSDSEEETEKPAKKQKPKKPATKPTEEEGE